MKKKTRKNRINKYEFWYFSFLWNESQKEKGIEGKEVELKIRMKR